MVEEREPVVECFSKTVQDVLDDLPALLCDARGCWCHEADRKIHLAVCDSDENELIGKYRDALGQLVDDPEKLTIESEYVPRDIATETGWSPLAIRRNMGGDDPGVRRMSHIMEKVGCDDELMRMGNDSLESSIRRLKRTAGSLQSEQILAVLMG